MTSSSPASTSASDAEERTDTTLVTTFDPSHQENEGADFQAILTCLSGPETGTVFRLEHAEHVMGRDDSADIVLEDAGLSRRHASINRTVHGNFLRDLGSTNGTYVNGNRVKHAHQLQDGDRIQMGKGTVLRFSLQDRLEQEAAERQYEMTVRDPLTGLYNRRYLDERLTSEFAYTSRHAEDLCVLMVDVDHFKVVNDTYGHAAGDEVLRRVGEGLMQMVRAEDLVARYGGEEFVILARGIDENGGIAFAERVRTYLGGLAIPHEEFEIKVTVSVGVAHTSGRSFSNVSMFLAAADGALYRAKEGGRNRVEVAEDLSASVAPAPMRRPPKQPSAPAPLQVGSGTSAVRPRKPVPRGSTVPLDVPPNQPPSPRRKPS